MKIIYLKRFFLLQILLLVCWMGYSQTDTLEVDSNNGELGLLNEVIAGDTTATGERVHAVYRLKRGQTYILSGAIENRSPSGVRFSLNIVAEDGDGERPRLVPGVISGGDSNRPFRARSDLTLKGLYVTGMDELGTLNPGQRIIRASADGARIVIDDCHLDQDGQSALRLDNANNKVYITNSIISNIGRPSNTNNGRLIDDRGNDIDTVILENSTIYNISSTLMNDRGGWIQYAKINQNTIVHTGGRIFDFADTQTGIFTNNLVINPGYLGEDVVDTVGAVYDERYLIEFDTLSADAISELPDVPQTFTISNNNIFLDSAIIKAYPQDTSAFADVDWGIDPRPLYNPSAEAFAGEAQLATNISEFVSFESSPSIDTLILIINEFWADPNSPDDKSSVRPWDFSNEPFDFSYQESFESASASTSGGALGSLLWDVILEGRDGLGQKIDEATDLVASAETGGNIGQYPQEAIDELNIAIAAAQAVFDDTSNSTEAYNNATAALDQAISDFLGMLITGFELGFSSELLIYPNPSTDFVSFSDPQAVSVEIWTISGALIGRSDIQENARLSVAPMRNGTYIFRIRKSDNSIRTVKFIKE